jgi:hypothetical protein
MRRLAVTLPSGSWNSHGVCAYCRDTLMHTAVKPVSFHSMASRASWPDQQARK